MKPIRFVAALSCVGVVSGMLFGGCAEEGATETPGGHGGALGTGGSMGTGGFAGAGGPATGGMKADASPGTGGSLGGTGGAPLPDALVGTGGRHTDGGAPGTGGRIGAGGRTGTGGRAGSGGFISVDGGVGVGQTCGTAAGLECSPGLFCDLVASDCGKIADASGTCVPTGPDILCTMEYAPVCGCDGKTYGNDCTRRAAGVLKASNGECATATGGRSGAGGMVGSGGTSGGGGQTGSNSTCGGPENLLCAEGLFCDLASDCGRIEDVMGTCVPTGPNIGCIALYAPVCGCDGKTYGNDCERCVAGVLKAADGECPAKRDASLPD